MAIGQEVFSSGSAPPTYSDEFSGNCHQGQPPNIWVHLGMNPMACRGQVFPQKTGIPMLPARGVRNYWDTLANPPSTARRLSRSRICLNSLSACAWYPCHRYSSASGNVCIRTARSTCPAFSANTYW